MVKRIHNDVFGTDRFGDQRAGLDVDLVGPRITGSFFIVCDAGIALGGNVLDQRSTQCNVEHLDAAADREHGLPARLCFLDERGFGRIARGVHRSYFFVAFFAVASWIDVFAASENEAGDGIENGRCCVDVRKRRNYEWYEPCIFQGSHVGGGQPDTISIAIGANASGNSNCAGWNRLARGRHE